MNQFERSVSSSLDGIFKQLVQLNAQLTRIATTLEVFELQVKESDE